MALTELTFEINKSGLLKETEKEILIEAYRELFIKMYGFDMFDSLIKVIDNSAKEVFERSEENQQLAINYLKAVTAIESVSEDDNLELFLVYENDNLIAGGRLLKKDNNTANIIDIAIIKEKIKDEKIICNLIIKKIEEYFINLGFDKMYLEVPLKDIKLLKLASELGFVEDPEDIMVDEEVYAYVINKKLERAKYE